MSQGRGAIVDLSPLEAIPDLPPPTPSALRGSSLLPMTTTDGFAFAFETADGPGSRHHAGSSGHHSSASSAAGVGSPLSTSGVPTVRTAGEFDDGLAPLGVLRLRAQSCPLGYPRGSRDLSLDLSPDLPDLIRVDLPAPSGLPLELAAEAATEAVGLSAEEGPTPNVSAAAAGGSFLEAAGAAVISAPVQPTDLTGSEGAARKVQERSVMKLMRPMSDPVSELQLQWRVAFSVTCGPLCLKYCGCIFTPLFHPPLVLPVSRPLSVPSSCIPSSPLPRSHHPSHHRCSPPCPVWMNGRTTCLN